jgi:CDP-diacylglycerol--glycerol-3-phosphate 3-phosphatidyltransferase
MPRNPAHIPILLTASRLALGPCIVALAYLWPQPAILAGCVLIAFLTDVFDGVLARRFNVATSAIRRFDTTADSVFYLCALWAVWILHPLVILDSAPLLGLLVALECIRYAFDFWKFRREASYHMWSSKLWGIALCVAFIAIFAMDRPGVLPKLAIVIGIIADVEGLLISLILPDWRHDVPSVVHALRHRAESDAA